MSAEEFTEYYRPLGDYKVASLAVETKPILIDPDSDAIYQGLFRIATGKYGLEFHGITPDDADIALSINCHVKYERDLELCREQEIKNQEEAAVRQLRGDMQDWVLEDKS